MNNLQQSIVVDNRPSLPIGDITIPRARRDRRELRGVTALADSIAEVGLIHPVTVTTDRVLVAGLHRIEAFLLLGRDTIPVNVVALDKIDAEILEIDENLRCNRYNALEECEAHARRQALYLAKHPETGHGGAPGKAGGGKVALAKVADPATFAPRYTATATTETGKSERTVREAVQIAKAIPRATREALRETPVAESKSDLLALARMEPETLSATVEQITSGKAKSVREAKQQIAQEEVAHQARQAPVRAEIVEAHAVKFLNTLADRSVDLLLTDPPYSTDVENLTEFVVSWLHLALSKVKDTGRAYVCIGAYPAELREYLDDLASESRMVLANVLVWTYRNTLGPSPRDDYKLNWQAILYLRGPDAPPLDCPVMAEQFSVQDINAPDGRQGDRFHAWQKPDTLAERLIRHSTKPDDLVVDPFSGTGTFSLAAARLGRRAIGAERDPAMVQLCIERGCFVRGQS